MVADHVAGPAFEALLIVEQDSAVIRRDEQLRRARRHARLRGAASADVRIDDDVCGVRHTEIDSLHAVVEADRSGSAHAHTVAACTVWHADRALGMVGAMGTTTNLITDDGFDMSAYLAEPTGRPKGGIVVVQEIFGVNIHIREVCDGFAADGYLAIAPALFDRVQRGVDLGYTAEDMGVGVDLARVKTDFDRAVLDTADAAKHLKTLLPAGGKVGCVGYCWGGVVTAASAMRSGASIECAVSYYGTGTVRFAGGPLVMPLLCHYGELDGSIPPADIETIRTGWPQAGVYVYHANHGFNCDHRPQHDADAATLARARTMAFFADRLG